MFSDYRATGLIEVGLRKQNEVTVSRTSFWILPSHSHGILEEESGKI